MKQSDRDFLALYDQYETSERPATKSELEDTLARVLGEGAGAVALEMRPGKSRTRTFPKRRRIWVAAAAACALLLAAAGVLKATDIFRNVLQEQGPDGAPVPISAMVPVVNQTGLVPGQTVIANGIEVTAQGLVGDNASLKLMLDIKGPEGVPLGIQQPDGTYSQGELQFALADMSPIDESTLGAGGYGYGMSTTVIDSDPTDNCASILLDFTVDELPLQGSKIKLTLQDLKQFAILDGTAMGLAPGRLGELLDTFGQRPDSDFEVNGYSEEGDVVTNSYELVKDSGTEAELVPGVMVTNAALRNGVFYLRGRGDDPRRLEELQHAPQLRDAQGGQVGDWDGAGWGDDGIWTISFRGIDSTGALAGCDWWYGAGEDLHTLAKGEWSFELTLDYESLARTVQLEESFIWDGHTFTANKLAVSPYTVQLNLEADSATRQAAMPGPIWGEYTPPTEWESSVHAIQLKMKDGTVLQLDNASSYIRDRENGGCDISYTYTTGVVVDVSNIEGVTVGDMTVSAERLVAP